MLTLPQGPRLQVQLQDVLAVVVGYGMAALMFRAFWPETRPSPALSIPVIGLYLWLGLVMSGPIILLRNRPRGGGSPDPRREPEPPGSRTWAELAWLLIGAYWIILGLIVIPARLHAFKLGDMILFGLIPVVFALGSRLWAPTPAAERAARYGWTHNAGVVLLATWPLAWVCLIVLGRALR